MPWSKEGHGSGDHTDQHHYPGIAAVMGLEQLEQVDPEQQADHGLHLPEGAVVQPQAAGERTDAGQAQHDAGAGQAAAQLKMAIAGHQGGKGREPGRHPGQVQGKHQALAEEELAQHGAAQRLAIGQHRLAAAAGHAGPHDSAPRSPEGVKRASASRATRRWWGPSPWGRVTPGRRRP